MEGEICTPCLDDIIVCSKSFQDHINHLRKVFQHLREHGVKLKPKKCKLFRRELNFFRRVVSAEGYKLDPATIAPVLNLAKTPPKMVGQVRQVLGLLGYYRRYIRDFSRIAKLIYDLLALKNTSRGSTSKETVENQRQQKQKQGQLPSNHPVNWTSEHQVVLENLLQQLTTPPIMAFPDCNKPFILHTDTSEAGLGGVLYQEQNDTLRVIAYGSRTLFPAESNYHLHSGKLEFLALKWSVCDQFRDYLYYVPSFRVYTDNHPLTYVLTSAKLNATGPHWVGELADFNFDIKYRPGKSYVDADTFSRMPLDFGEYMKTCTEEVGTDEIQAIASSAQVQADGGSTWITTLTDNPAVLTSDPTLFKQSHSPQIQQVNITGAQIQDRVIGRVRSYLKSGKRPTSIETSADLPATKQLLFEWKRLKVNSDNILRHISGPYKQIVLPRKFHQLVYKELHEEMGHLGAEKMTNLARQCFYWPRMQSDIEFYISKVCCCLKQRVPALKPRAPLQPITTSSPFELVSIDFFTLGKEQWGIRIYLGNY